MLKLDTTLHRVPELFVEVDTTNAVRVHHAGRVLRLGHEALGLLDVFHTPRSVGEGLRRLGPRLSGPRAMEEALATVALLANAGILRDSPVPGFSDLPFPKGGYDQAFAHIAMLSDRVRKRTFLKAVREVIREGDTVLDLGTGTGILAVAAAQAGARRVYAVEPAGMLHLAEEVAARNGVADRITFLRGWSTQIELPEPADVLTTDIVGNDALDMVIWETLQDAQRRLLVDEPRLVPHRLSAHARLVAIPPEYLAQHCLDEPRIETWRKDYGIDFGPLLEADRRRVIGLYERPEVVQSWRPLSSPQRVLDIDLTDDVRHFEVPVAIPVERDGEASGVVISYEVALSPQTSLSTDPWGASAQTHWFSPIWVLAHRRQVHPGEAVEVTYAYDGDGHPRVLSTPTNDVEGATACS